MIHLDTTFLVDLLREQSRGTVGPASVWLEGQPDEELGISVFVACELFNGAERSTQPERESAKVQAICDALHLVVPDRAFAPAYGRLLADLQRRGEPVATMDLLIATACVQADEPLVTRNLRHFQRIPGLRLLSY